MHLLERTSYLGRCCSPYGLQATAIIEPPTRHQASNVLTILGAAARPVGRGRRSLCRARACGDPPPRCIATGRRLMWWCAKLAGRSVLTVQRVLLEMHEITDKGARSGYSPRRQTGAAPPCRRSERRCGNKKRHRISPAALLLSEHICRRPSSVPPSTKRAIVLAAQRSGFAGHSDECAEAFKRLVDDVADAHIALPEVVGEPAITAVGPISTP